MGIEQNTLLFFNDFNELHKISKSAFLLSINDLAAPQTPIAVFCRLEALARGTCAASRKRWSQFKEQTRE